MTQNQNYTPNEYKLALEIAEALDDKDQLALHISFVQKYSESFLRKQLMKAMAVPERNIRKSRGALYTSLVTRNGPANSGARP